jgi:hypothetical protein
MVLMTRQKNSRGLSDGLPYCKSTAKYQFDTFGGTTTTLTLATY